MMDTVSKSRGAEASQPTVSLITPPGEGGIGIVLLRGRGARELLGRHFRGASVSAGELQCGDLAYGHIERNEGILDEVIVAWVHATRGGPHFEINCHGGVAAVRAVLECFQDDGAIRVRWRELLDEKQESTRPLASDSIRAAAYARLPRAETRLAARILLHQLNGALVRELKRVARALREGEGAGARLESLLQYSDLGRAIVEPPTVLLTGPPNAGKSTLLNALLQRERVIVHHQPGTTRDVVRETVSLEGVPFELMDSAGVRGETGDVEAEAVHRVRRLFGECDVLVLMYDAREPLKAVLQAISPPLSNRRLIIVGNKVDLLEGQPSEPDLPPPFRCASHVFISARNGTGVERLENALLAPYHNLLTPAKQGAPVPFTPGIISALEELAEINRNDASRAAARLRTLMGRNEPSDPVTPHNAG
jgi:tRNA modification GTPase